MKKYPEIKPQYLKDQKNKILGVYLDMNTFKSILEEIDELSTEMKKKSGLKKNASVSKK